MKATHTIQTLWEHAAPRLPDPLLERLASADDAVDALRHVADLLADLGRQICADADQRMPAAHFQNADRLPSLFQGLASSIALQAELVAVASAAGEILRQRGS